MTDAQKLLAAIFAPMEWYDELGDSVAEGICPVCQRDVEFSILLETQETEPFDQARCTRCGYTAPCDIWESETFPGTLYAWVLQP